MNYNKFFLKILTLLVIAKCGIVLPMNHPIPVAEQPVGAQFNLTLEERAEILANAQNATNSMQGFNIDTTKIINDFNADQQKRLDDAERDEINTLQWQNTIRIGNPNFPVAIYNKDFITASSLLVNLIAINALNNQLYECRVNHIYASLIENADTLITLLEQAKEEKETLNQEWLEKDILSKLSSKFQKSPYIKKKELEDFIEQEHNFIQYNPFKQALLGSLGTAFTTQKITSFAEAQFLAKNSCKKAAFCSFSENADGTLQQHNGAFLPLSATSVVKWGLFPGLATEWGDMIPDIKNGLLNIPTDALHGTLLQSLGVPAELYAILHSPITNIVIQIFSLGLGTKMINNMYQARWHTHIFEKQDQLIELLYAYNDTKSLPEKAPAKESIRNELKQFVIDGNAMSTLNQLCDWNFIKQAFNALSFYRSLPILGIVAWNWRNEIAAQFNKLNNINNDNYNDNN